LLAIGDPVLNGASAATRTEASGTGQAAALARACRQDGPIEAGLLRALDPLPDSSREIRSIAKVLGQGQGASLLLTQQRASERTLRAQALGSYRVLYFATHGLLPGELRCRTEPALVLTPEDQAREREHDGLLEASEIASLRLNADLVVLSACNTAGFDQRPGGDALSGLAEAFLYAGARGLLASHWRVSSAATTGLMSELFARLGPDVRRGSAQALRQAQIALSESPQTAHPFFWAAFTLIGDGIDQDMLPVRGPASPVLPGQATHGPRT
jgi:CHAT domain-containing protein